METKTVEQAQQAAEAALAAAQNARDAAEAQYLDSITSVKVINEGRTQFEANRLKSRFISLYGFARWQKLIANSR